MQSLLIVLTADFQGLISSTAISFESDSFLEPRNKVSSKRLPYVNEPPNTRCYPPPRHHASQGFICKFSKKSDMVINQSVVKKLCLSVHDRNK